MKDHILAAQHKETLAWHGLFYINNPTPSGSPRPRLMKSTTDGFDSPKEAVEAMRDALKESLSAEQFQEIECHL